jgi:ubiquinone/menaquinone biosynthesis C-methylase UbiE
MAVPTKRNALPRFQRWSSTYERSWLQTQFFEPAHRAMVQAMKQHLTPPQTVLDVGCGTGRLLRSVHEFWPDAALIGVDPAAGMLEVARELTPSATFEVGFAEALPVSDASVDLAMSSFSFHHWSDQEAGLRELARVLHPGGYLVLADAALPPWLARFFARSHFRSAAQVQILVEHAGLHVVHQQSAVHNRALITIGKN